ncbi:MAG: phenylalanine--tRNA ligase subunit beta, partial [Atopobiaceae bacterium]|nr:phenylalanine--tRNA ligase subunit beta [Atopobiaceae bacterium]MBQ6411175.1 phenylalanine--tRNA ligase subunit beta [Atopobiaceae bacterium]
MRVSYEWLKEMVDLPADPATLVSEFVRTGTEVEAVEDTASALRNVVTGHVVEAHAHPDSDHMQVCTVDVGGRNLGADGAPEPLQIVCGAPNMRTGLDVVVALIGAVLPGGFEITR